MLNKLSLQVLATTFFICLSLNAFTSEANQIQSEHVRGEQHTDGEKHHSDEDDDDSEAVMVVHATRTINVVSQVYLHPSDQ